MRDNLFRYPEFKEAAKEQRAFEKKMRLTGKELKVLDKAVKRAGGTVNEKWINGEH